MPTLILAMLLLAPTSKGPRRAATPVDAVAGAVDSPQSAPVPSAPTVFEPTAPGGVDSAAGASTTVEGGDPRIATPLDDAPLAPVTPALELHATPPPMIPAADDGRLTVLLMPLRPERVSAAVTRVVERFVAAELATRSGLRVLTFADLESLLEIEKAKDLLGCDDVTCASEIGGALGADRIVSGALSHAGDEYLLSLSWWDAQFVEPLAFGGETVRKQADLPEAARRAVRMMLDTAKADDDAALERKKAPTYWTVEASGAFSTRFEPEPYQVGVGGTLRVSWGGLWESVGVYLYAIAGVAFDHLSGSKSGTVGHIAYERQTLEPFLEVRAAFGVANQRRTRVFLGGGGGVASEWHSASQDAGLRVTGQSFAPSFRAVAGLWHRFGHRVSVFGHYRLRGQAFGAGADPLSELVQLGSTTRVALSHGVELGCAVHF